MCEIKPGDRCASDAREPAQVALHTYQGAHPDGPAIGALQNAEMKSRYVPVDASTEISVVDPDDQFGTPLYEGEARRAGWHLHDGSYVAKSFDGEMVFSLQVGEKPTFTTIATEDALDEPISALRFNSQGQGFGEPVYWVGLDELRRLQDAGRFACKEDFDEDFSSTYLDLSGDEPVEHIREDVDRCVSQRLASREFQGEKYYSLEGYSLWEPEAPEYGTASDAQVHDLMMRTRSLRPVEVERLGSALFDGLGTDYAAAAASCPQVSQAVSDEAGKALDYLPKAHTKVAELDASGGFQPARSAALMAAKALAARDLIGYEPGWGQGEYDLLTAPWRKAIGPLHPEDPPLSEQY